MSHARLAAAAIALSTCTLATPGPAMAHEDPDVVVDGAFDRWFGVGAYAAGWEGGYRAVGVGGKIRFELIDMLGLEVFAEALVVEWPTADRHDFPMGFWLYVPWTLTEGLRLEPKLGLCLNISQIEGDEGGAPGAEDILFGFNAGLGLEYELGRVLSIFIDTHLIGYWGHERDVVRWTGAVGEDLVASWHFRMAAGVMLHL